MISIPLWAIPTVISVLAIMFLSIGVFSSKFVTVKKFEDAIVRIEDKLDSKVDRVYEKIDALKDKFWPPKK